MTTHVDKEEVKIIREKVTSVTCDYCGAEMWRSHSFIKGGKVILEQFGYGSDYDAEYWEFDICDDCVPRLLAIFDENKRQLSKNPNIPLKRCD